MDMNPKKPPHRRRIVARALVLLLTAALLSLTAQVTNPPAAQANPACDLLGAAGGLIGGGTIGDNCNDAAGAMSGVAGDWITSKMGEFVTSMLDGMGRGLQWALSWWIKIPSPDLENYSGLQAVRDYTFELQLILLIGSVIMTGFKLGMAKRASLVSETQELFHKYSQVIFASWLYTAMIVVFCKAGDAFSNWVLADVTNGDPGQMIENYVKIDTLTHGSLGMAPLLIIGIVGFLGALAQVVLLVVRQAFLLVVAAMIPLAAASGGSGAGSQSYKKLIAWSVGFALFKPVGALLYVIAFTSAKTDSGDQQQILLGLILLSLTAAILPMLMKLVTPAVGTMGSGGSGLGATLAAAAGAKMAAGGMKGGGGAAAGGSRAGMGGGGSMGSAMASAGPLGGGGSGGSRGGGSGGSSGGGSSSGSGGRASGGGRSSWSQRASGGGAGQQSGGGAQSPPGAGGAGAGAAINRALSSETRTPPPANGEVPQ